MTTSGRSPVFLTVKESESVGAPSVRSVEFYSMGDGTAAITISTEGEPEDSGTVAIVGASELGAVARALPVLGIVPVE
jgi:hypothetical protein